MAASQVWYVPHRPDLVLLAPCDAEGPLPCPGSVFVSVDHLHPPPQQKPRKDQLQQQPQQQQEEGASQPSAPARAAPAAAVPIKWRNPRAPAYVTCYGDIARQQPRVVRCACGAQPCRLRDLKERSGVPDELIPADWVTKYELPPEGPEHAAPENRRAAVIQGWLDCTKKAEKELPPAEGQERATEEDIKQAADEMLTDYLKGRVCYNCNLPSTRMQKCGRCHQARYCSTECQRMNWPAHKPECKPPAAAVATVAAAAEPEGATPGPDRAPATEPTAATAAAAAEAPAEVKAPSEASPPPTAASQGPGTQPTHGTS